MKKVQVTTKPIITEIEDVNRVAFHIFFPIKYKKSNTINRLMLRRLLQTSSKTYNTPEKMGKAKEELFILSYDVSTVRNKNYELFQFDLTVPKEGIIDDFSLEKALKFFFEMIFNPSINGNRFDEGIFNYEKNFLLEREKDFPNGIEDFAYDEYHKMIDPKDLDGLSHDSYVEQLNKVSSRSVYKYYRNAILKNNYFTFISGAVEDRKKLLELYSKFFKLEYKELKYNVDYFNIHKPAKYEEKVIEKDYNQSMLFLHYNIHDYKEDEYLLLGLFGYLLDAKENNLIFHKLRVEHNLIYTYNFNRQETKGYFDIVVYLDYEDVEKVKELINEIFDSLRDEEFFNKCKNRTIKAMTYDLLSMEDNPFNKANELMQNTLSYSVSLDERIELMKNISYEDMMQFMDRIENTKTLIIKGGEHHE